MTTVEPIVLSELKHKHNLPIVTRLDIDGTLYELHDANLDAELENLEQALVNTQEAVNSVAEDLNTINSYIGNLEVAINNKASKISYTADVAQHKYITSVGINLEGDSTPVVLGDEDLTANAVLASNLTEYSTDDEYSPNAEALSYLASYGTDNETGTDKTFLTHDVLVYLLKKVNTMSGIDPELIASLEKIIAELEGNDTNEAASAWITLVDKLKGLGDETVKQYVDRITNNLWVSFPSLSYATVHNYEFTYNEENTTLSFTKNDLDVYLKPTEEPSKMKVFYESAE